MGISQANLVAKLSDPSVKLGTSTPVLDPGGDYAWKMFDMADSQKPGASAALKAKAIKLVGDPALPMPPKGYPRSQIAWHIEEGRADVFLVYLTTARLAVAELPGLEIIELPKELAVGAQYGLSVVTGAKPEAAQFKAFVLGPKGQAILAGYGFQKP
jgi:ABC-type molybdate transport system substrate-binding protein